MLFQSPSLCGDTVLCITLPRTETYWFLYRTSFLEGILVRHSTTVVRDTRATASAQSHGISFPHQ